MRRSSLAWTIATAHAAANCAKMAGCRNLIGGDQTRPILEGAQSFTEVDGSCRFGHVAKKHDCKPGPSCGHTLFDCTCISERAAEENSTGARNSRFLFGGTSGLVAVAILLCAWLWRRGRYKQPSKVAPTIGLPMTLGHSQSPFTGICIEQGPVIAEDHGTKKGAANCDCLTILLLVFLPGSLLIAGAAIFASGVGIHVGEYYNGCRV